MFNQLPLQARAVGEPYTPRDPDQPGNGAIGQPDGPRPGTKTDQPDGGAPPDNEDAPIDNGVRWGTLK